MAFDQFSTLKRGKDLTRDQFRDGSVPVAGSNGVIGFHDTANVRAPGITVGRSGSVGRVTFFTQDIWAHNTALFVANLHGNDARFAAYFLNFLELGRFGSGASVPTLDRNSFRLMPVIVPPFAEQGKIAGVLGLVQRAMEQQERLIALTTELKKALLHQLFTHGLRGEPQKQTEIGPVPQSWRVTRLDEFCILQRGFDIIKKDQVAGDVPVVSSGGIASYHNIAKVKGPGVVVGRKGTLGKVHYLDGNYWPHDTTLWVKDFKGHDPLFTSYFLKTLRLERYNSGASNPTLNRNTVHAELVAYPAIDEQGAIGRVLRMVDDKAKVHAQRHAALTDLFRTLLHHLMTAQILVTDLDIME